MEELKVALDKQAEQLARIEEKLSELTKQKDVVSEGLEKAKEYMLKNYNVRWLNDEIEEDVYDTMIEIIKKFI